MLTQRIQVQAIADRMAGLPVKGNMRRLTEPWLSCWKALDGAAAGQYHNALMEALQEFPDRGVIMEQILAARPGAALGEYASLEELAKDLPPIEWVWRGWIPRGMITLLGAAPGAGKSFLALDLAKRIVQHESWPDGQVNTSQRRNILYVDAEQVPQLANERALSWGIPRSKLYFLLPEADDMIDFGKPRYRDLLTEMAYQLQPELVILDSLSSISSKGENNVEDVRVVLGFLNMLAQEYKVGLVLIHHLRKGSNNGQLKLWDVSMDDFRGSGHIIAMARSVMGVSVVQTAAEADRNGPRKVEIIKTNLGPYPEALGFEFAPLHPKGVFLNWGNAPQAYHEPTKEEECREWLLMLITNAPEGIKPKEAVEAGEEYGYARAMIYRARNELKAQIVNTLGRKHPENLWKRK
jgi:hypothetical protein